MMSTRLVTRMSTEIKYCEKLIGWIMQPLLMSAITRRGNRKHEHQQKIVTYPGLDDTVIRRI